jgi:hypothetical protein
MSEVFLGRDDRPAGGGAERHSGLARRVTVVLSNLTLASLALSTALAVAAPALLSAQGLAAIAKKEEERRKSVKSGKVYTNEDLTADITASSVPATPTNTSSPAPSTQVPSVNLPAGEAPPAGEVKDEAYWRSRITAARSALERSRIFGDALQSRINALTTDIVNRADPAQRAQLELERQRALAELDRVKKEIAEQTQAITDIEEEARKAGVPPGWLR